MSEPSVLEGAANEEPVPWSRHPLELVKESKIFELLGDAVDHRLEASGVCGHAGACYVIFDNSAQIARLDPSLSKASPLNEILVPGGGRSSGFEDITYDATSDHFFLVIEAVERTPGVFMAEVQEHDADGRYLSGAYLDFSLDRPNKGLEGLACIEQDGEPLLLGLCEGNRCKGGDEGKEPGGGSIQVFKRGLPDWDRVETLRLPAGVAFEDYASLAVTGDRIAVVSQASSALWVAPFSASTLELGTGTMYQFPRDAGGKTVYCTVEGVSWLGDRLVMVSDRAKKDDHHARCRAKDQSIHLFTLPGDA